MKSIKVMVIGLLLSGSMSFGMAMDEHWDKMKKSKAQQMSIEQAMEIVYMQFSEALKVHEYCQKASQTDEACIEAKELIDAVLPLYAKTFKGAVNIAKELQEKFDSIGEN